MLYVFQDETSRFREMLTKAVRTNKRKVDKIVIAQKETESAEESEVQEYVTWYLDSIFPEVTYLFFFFISALACVKNVRTPPQNMVKVSTFFPN